MMSRIRLVIALVLGAWSSGASGQQPEGLDCVIEPRSVVDLTASVEGVIQEILVSRGDLVEKGRPVVQLDDVVERLQVELAELRANSDVELRSEQARFDLRQHELERVNSLRSKNVAAETQVEEAEIEAALAELAVESAETGRKLAQVEHAQAQARLERRRLSSPIKGVVLGVDAAPGEFAHEQMTILRIAETDPLHVEIFAPAELFGRIQLGQSYRIIPMDPIEGEYVATVSVVDPVFDAASGTFGVRLELPNPDALIPAGIRCRLLLESS